MIAQHQCLNAYSLLNGDNSTPCDFNAFQSSIFGYYRKLVADLLLRRIINVVGKPCRMLQRSFSYVFHTPFEIGITYIGLKVSRPS